MHEHRQVQVFSQFPGALKMVGRALAVQQPPIPFVGLLEVCQPKDCNPHSP